MRRRVMVWGLSGDAPFDAVRRELERMRAPSLIVDQRDAAVRVDVDALDDIHSYFARPHDPADALESADHATRVAAHAWQFELYAGLEIVDGLVINRPSAVATNSSKPFQAELIRRAGFDVPATLVTTSPEHARSFIADHGSVVYKSVSHARSVVTRLADPRDERIDDVVNAPTQFQAYVAGTDWRVHVVGDELFACEIDCDADDYRAPEDSPIMLRAARLPADVAGRCMQLARALNLVVTGIDLRRGDDGAWYCFEANPAPAFTYYEGETGQPLGAAVAALLVRGLSGKRAAA